eukprot:4701726-Prymnesium_polylepis.1
MRNVRGCGAPTVDSDDVRHWPLLTVSTLRCNDTLIFSSANGGASSVSTRQPFWKLAVPFRQSGEERPSVMIARWGSMA